MALLLLLLLQGIPALPNQSGTVSGILRAADGKPAVGVRVSAMARPDNPQDALGGSSMAGISETDEAGRFRLENIPPGRYYIVAGRLDLPTYFPGTQDMGSATVVRITSGANLPGLDFVMKDSSSGRVYETNPFGPIASGVNIPLKLTLEDGARLPVFAAGRRYSLPFVQLKSFTAGGRVSSLSTYTITSVVAVVPQGEYTVTVEDLPDGLAVKSITYETNDLKTSTLIIPTPITPVAGTPFSFQVALRGPTPLAIALTTAPRTDAGQNGVRVLGRMKDVKSRSVYLDGVPGVIYSDGTFEFRGVPPGRHAIVTPDHGAGARPFAASIIVGDRDIDAVELEEVAVLPPDIRDVVAPAPSGTHPVGLPLPLAGVRGQVILEMTGKPVSGAITILGLLRAEYPINTDGRFEIPRLLPGNYTLEVSIADHPAASQPVVVGDEDVQVSVMIR
jgi:hypothetical protein